MIFQTDSSSYRVISRITAGFTAGGMAAAIATPTELLKVRAQEGFQIEQLHPMRSLLLQWPDSAIKPRICKVLEKFF